MGSNTKRRTTMAKLNREHQEVLTLRFLNDCSVSETAKAMGKNEGAVRVLQHRALAALRRQLKRPEGGRKS